MTLKKPAASKRANLPRASDYTKGFLKDWQRLSHPYWHARRTFFVVTAALSLQSAADSLGMTRRMIAYYRTGSKPIPRVVGLACKGWEVEHRRHA